MKESVSKKYINFFYTLSLFIKALDGIIEIAAGIFIYFYSQNAIQYIISVIIRRELGEDPNDTLLHYFLTLAQNLSVNSREFIVLYVIFHGIIKLFLSICLLQHKIWAYPIGIAFFILFPIYQLYRYTHTHSIWLIILSIFDLFIAWLVFREYQFAQTKLKN